MLLSRGKLVYYGPAAGVLDYFRSIGMRKRDRERNDEENLLFFSFPSPFSFLFLLLLGHECPEYANPGDYLMKLLHEASKQDDLEDAEKRDAKKSTAYFHAEYEKSVVLRDWRSGPTTPPPIEQQASKIHVYEKEEK
jgi:hypothetical protein